MVRFIPAYAGNSKQSSTPNCAKTVHPRLRGELLQPLPSSNSLFGSSPLTRGTLLSSTTADLLLRFIPAYAGNSQLRQPPLSAPAVHPRLRGELDILRGKWESPDGSSPLTRGTLYRGGGGVFPYPVHPRLRGELRPLSNHNTLIFGSSPLMRGTLPWCLEYRPEWRFIPAYAGNSIGREKRHEF